MQCFEIVGGASFFEEALPLGNGKIGAMVYGGTSTDKLSLNDITLWTGEPDKGGNHIDYTDIQTLTPWGEASSWINDIREALDKEDYATADRLHKKIQGHYSENYQPLGELTISYPEGEISEYRRKLDIANATAEVSYLRNGKAFKSEYFISSPDSVIVIRLTSEEPIEAVIRIDSPQPHVTETIDEKIVSDGYAAYHSFPVYCHDIKDKFLYDPDRGIHYRTVVRCDQARAEGSTLKHSGVNEAVIFVSNCTSFAGFDKDPVKEGAEYKDASLRNNDNAASQTWETLKERHIADYKEMFDRVSIDLGKTDPAVKALTTDRQLLRYADGEENPELEALYFQYGR